MTEVEQSIFGAALSLPLDSRSRLAELLLDSLATEGSDAEVADEIRSAWIDAANQRMKQVEGAEVELVPGDQVMERFRQRTET